MKDIQLRYCAEQNYLPCLPNLIANLPNHCTICTSGILLLFFFYKIVWYSFSFADCLRTRLKLRGVWENLIPKVGINPKITLWESERALGRRFCWEYYLNIFELLGHAGHFFGQLLRKVGLLGPRTHTLPVLLRQCMTKTIEVLQTPNVGYILKRQGVQEYQIWHFHPNFLFTLSN